MISPWTYFLIVFLSRPVSLELFEMFTPCF